MPGSGRVVLDSWPVVGTLRGLEPSASAVRQLMTQQVPIMSAVNYAEVYSVMLMTNGVEYARDSIGYLRYRVSLEVPTYERIMQALHLKSTFHMALGDGFAVATALDHDAELWTGDAELLFASRPWRARDMRPPAPSGRALTVKGRRGKIGPRVRVPERSSGEPEIALKHLMGFLDSYTPSTATFSDPFEPR